MTKRKEEIWINRNPSCEGDGCFAHKTAMMCMDEYAKQEAIGFAEWFVSDDNPYQNRYWSEDDNDGKWHDPFSEGINRHYYTTEQLYHLYQQTK